MENESPLCELRLWVDQDLRIGRALVEPSLVIGHHVVSTPGNIILESEYTKGLKDAHTRSVRLDARTQFLWSRTVG